MTASLRELREEIQRINRQLLALLCRRGEVVQQIGQLKDAQGIDHFDPRRESEMLADLLRDNAGPFPDATIAQLFKEIFRASAALMGLSERQQMKVHRHHGEPDRVLQLGEVHLGGGPVELIAGPCAVESERQLDAIAAHLRAAGVRLLRGGAYKPRTSPYAFQGLREEGLVILQRVAQRHGMKTISEIVDTRDLDLVCRHVDVLQIGSRNMQNYELLRVVGQTQHPVLLKRGFMSTLEELILAAEYVAMEGNQNLVLCERGIRTFERWTRNTLDLSAIPLLKREVCFPIVVDLSHSLGRKDILAPLARAAVAAGADALMLEVHDQPAVALSDSAQQLSLTEFTALMSELAGVLSLRAKSPDG
jgi:3-deoxy-7-phosphoheptulonate synthase / chorismate mutase